VEEAQQRISSRQFAEWRAYYELEPFGQPWLAVGKLAACWSTRNIRPVDFYPADARTEQTNEQIEHVLRGFAAAMQWTNRCPRSAT
jgi:hypothetical protein